jgi:peptidylprolyl isomerase
MVGVARDLAPSTGSGAELYTVIGHAPRHLDRNIAIVGRVVEGIQWLSSLPRGGGALGVYENPTERVPILSARLASQLPDDERPHFQYRATDNVRFAAWLSERENRKPPFFTVPAGGADICNAQAPIRRTP